MKKFLSIFLTLCLMLTVVAVPLPAMAETTNRHFYDFENYSVKNKTLNQFIGYSGRVAAVTDPENADNTVIKFDNYGIPYRDDAMDKTNTYTKSGSTYTKATEEEINAALAADSNAYSNYYHRSATYKDFTATAGIKNSIEMYNAIDLNLQLETSTEYRITINYKRENLANVLYVHPVTWAKMANQRPNFTAYDEGRIAISKTTTPDSDYVTVSTFITTPEAFNTSGTDGKYVGDTLRLILYTGVVDAYNVVYFDNISVEKITRGDLTYHYANGDTEVVKDLVVGDAIAYAELKANKMGENNGVWYADAQGTTVAPAAMVEGGLDVYEVVQTGVFDFNNYYRYHDYTGNKYGINTAAVVDSIYADGNGNIVVDTTKYGQKTNTGVGALRNYVIAIGEAKAATSYKITVDYSYNADNENQRLVLTPMTGYGTLTYTNVNGKGDAIIIGDSVELPQGTNQTIDLFYTSVDEFFVNGDKTESDYSKAETGEVANSFYLNVITEEDGQTAGDNAVYATISKVTVTEAKGSVTYNIPANATVDGKNGEVILDYFGDEVPSFPKVQIAEGYESTGWTDTVTGAAVETPVLGGNYTLGVKKAVEKVTVTLNRGGVTEEVPIEKGTEFTLPDTQFTDTSWWFHETATVSSRFAGYEGEKIKVNGNVTFYTAETYSYGRAVDQGYKADQGIYRYWTGIDTTTEDFSYLYKEDTSGSAWPYSGGYRVCTRLGVVEDGKTYRISVTYKADTDAAINFYMLTTNVGNSGASTRNYLEGGKKFHVVAAGTKNEDWTTATFYITVDLPAQVTANADNSGLDDTKAVLHDTLYLNLGKATGGENVNIYIKETLVEDMGVVVTAKGASVLKEEKVVNGKQALRYYFDYKTGGNGTTIIVGDKEYDVVERGFLYTNGAITHYAGAGTAGNSGNQTGNYFVCTDVNAAYGFTASDFMMWLAHAKKSANAAKLTYKGITEGFENNWAFNDATDTVTFSTYVTGIPTESYDAKMMVRGYVIFEDENGVQHTIYSQTVNRSVNGIKTALGAAGEHEKHKD